MRYNSFLAMLLTCWATIVFSQVQFTSHTIVAGSNFTRQASSVYAADVDGDEDVDVLSASYKDNKVAWYGK